MKIFNKVIVVTGAGSGIGQAMTLYLLKKGAKVVAVDINLRGLEETFEIAGRPKERLFLYQVDITQKTQIEELIAFLKTEQIDVDGLINNAGVIQPFEKFVNLDEATIERVIGINLLGPIQFTRLFLPLLFAREEAHIVNISSMGGFLPVPAQSIYGVSKAGVKLFSEALQTELMGTHIKLSLVMPGGMETKIAANSDAELPMDRSKIRYKMMAPEKAAKKIIDGMERNRKRMLIGWDAQLMDVFYRISPTFATFMISKVMRFLIK